jgi:hypothetical protein
MIRQRKINKSFMDTFKNRTAPCDTFFLYGRNPKLFEYDDGVNPKDYLGRALYWFKDKVGIEIAVMVVICGLWLFGLFYLIAFCQH